MAVAEPTLSNPVIPPSTNLTALEQDTSAVKSNISGAFASIIGKEKIDLPKREKIAPMTEDTPPEIPFVDKSGKEKEKPVEEAVEEKKPTTEDATDDVSTESGQPEEKEKKRWGELKEIEKKHKAAQKEISELRAKIADADKGSVELDNLRAELRAAKEDRDSIDQEFYLTRVEATKEYKQFVTEPLLKTYAQAEALAQRTKLDPSSLKNALAQDAQGNAGPLEELLADVNEREKQRIYALSDQLIAVADRESDIRSNSKQAYEASILKDQERQRADIEKSHAAREAAVQKVMPKLIQEVIDKLPQDKRPDMDRLGKEVLNIDSWPDDLKVYGGLAAAVLPDIIDDNKSLRTEIEELKKQNSKLRNGAPSTSGGKTPTAPSEAQKPTDYSKLKEKDFIGGMLSRIGH